MDVPSVTVLDYASSNVAAVKSPNIRLPGFSENNPTRTSQLFSGIAANRGNATTMFMSMAANAIPLWLEQGSLAVQDAVSSASQVVGASWSSLDPVALSTWAAVEDLGEVVSRLFVSASTVASDPLDNVSYTPADPDPISVVDHFQQATNPIVEAHLSRHPHLVPWLSNLQTVVPDFFGTKFSLEVELVRDDESESWETLFVVVRTPLDAKSAVRCLSRMIDQWLVTQPEYLAESVAIDVASV